MYLEPWMLGTLALTFGICAVWNYRKGIRMGAFNTLEVLENDKIIMIDTVGNIKPYTPYKYKRYRKSKT